MLEHLVLPVTVVAIQSIAVYTRYMRASLLDVLNSDYLRTARSKGISERRVLVNHAMRNAMLPIVTLAAIDFASAVRWADHHREHLRVPGDGAVTSSPRTATVTSRELMPWMVIVVLAVILFNLLADLSYAFLDPRIRLD